MFSSVKENNSDYGVKQPSFPLYSPSKRESLGVETDRSDMTDKMNNKRVVAEMPITSFDSKITAGS
jgi:hypothetical protein